MTNYEGNHLVVELKWMTQSRDSHHHCKLLSPLPPHSLLLLLLPTWMSLSSPPFDKNKSSFFSNKALENHERNMCLSTFYIIMCTSLFDKKIHDTFLNIWYLGVVFASQTLARLQLPIFGPVIIRDLNPKKYNTHIFLTYIIAKKKTSYSLFEYRTSLLSLSLF